MSAPVARTSRMSTSSVQATRQQLDELDALLQKMLDLPVNKVEPEPEEPAPFQRSLRPKHGSSSRSLEADLPSSTSDRKSYPASYMVVETSGPAFLDELVPGEPGLQPRRVEPQADHPLYSSSGSSSEESFPSHQDSPSPESSEESASDWVPFRSSWQPSAQTWKPLAETWHQARTPPEEEPVTEIRPRPILPSASPEVIPPPIHSDHPGPWAASESSLPAQPSVHSELSLEPFVSALPQEVPSSATVSSEPIPAQASPSVSGFLLPLLWFNYAFDLCLLPLGPLGTWLRQPAGRGILGTVGMLALLGAAVLAAADGFGWTR